MSMNWKQALALGLCSVGAYAGQREPVAYFYPSLVLPELPEWDKEKYPFAVIDYFAPDDIAYLYCCEVELEKGTLNGSDAIFMNATAKTTVRLFEFEVGVYSDWLEIEPLHPECEKYGVVFSTYPPSYIAWANFDLLNEDGSVYLSASESIPAGNGMAAYKGVKLPELPEWDRETYPYAFIAISATLNPYYYIVCTDKPILVYEDFSIFESADIETGERGNAYLVYKHDEENGTWVFGRAEERGYAVGMNSPPVWSNHDLHNLAVVDFGDDDAIWFTASDPIPVYD